MHSYTGTNQALSKHKDNVRAVMENRSQTHHPVISYVYFLYIYAFTGDPQQSEYHNHIQSV